MVAANQIGVEGGKGSDAEPIPLSALQHAVFCLRQAALIHLERLWEENRFTAEGHVLHISADKMGSRKVRGVRWTMALPLSLASKLSDEGDPCEKKRLNTVYVTTEGMVLRKDGENLVAELDGDYRSGA